MKNRYVVFLYSVLLLSGIPVHAIVESNGNASYDAVRSIKCGTSTSYLLKKFGKPDRIDPFDNNSNTWVYDEKDQSGPYQRLGIAVDKKRGTVTGVAILIDDHEPESNLNLVQKKFPGQKFTAYSRPQCKCMDVQPAEVDYINSDASVAITVNSSISKIVESVDWGAPGTMKPFTCERHPKPCDWVAIFGGK